MKKVSLFVGIAIGFLLGSMAGRGPYDEFQEKMRQIANRPEINEAIATVTEAVSGTSETATAPTATQKGGAKV